MTEESKERKPLWKTKTFIGSCVACGILAASIGGYAVFQQEETTPTKRVVTQDKKKVVADGERVKHPVTMAEGNDDPSKDAFARYGLATEDSVPGLSEHIKRAAATAVLTAPIVSVAEKAPVILADSTPTPVVALSNQAPVTLPPGETVHSPVQPDMPTIPTNPAKPTVPIAPEPPMVREAPVLYAENQVIDLGTTFHPLANVSATDALEGDVSQQVEILTNTVNTEKNGVYEVAYRIANSSGLTASKTIEVVVNSKPSITLTKTEVTLDVNTPFYASSYASATHWLDGDITGNIVAVGGLLNTAQEGDYQVIYIVTDRYGYESQATLIVHVTNEAPVIHVSHQVIAMDSVFDPLAGVTASDKESGDLTDKIQVVENTVNSNVEGVYQVTYEVSDGNGKTTRITIDITVQNDAPEIQASDHTIPVGADFDALENVTASDKQDGDLTSSIQVTENTVDTSTEGDYMVSYLVTDSHGKQTTKSIVVHVTNEAPVIQATDIVLPLDTAYDPLAGVKAYDQEDGDITSALDVLENTVDTSVAGSYSVTYSITDSHGKNTQKTITVTIE
ncbi:DUF5011 domain-containing protein [Listeria rocourtiae]|uniref:immunoglobulin-like domain-containing protein n=1 Tax=Listeria rocourtiae TaxID=647910 RepID=UPI001623ECF3|nr:immunoglobulin-like domain-containing protein [Listeria rocourtiae]MBC1604467.1 DUF5011 domain-containing protein [Listeria rocourtiae]